MATESLPWFPLHVSIFLEDQAVIDMSGLDVGIYVRLLCYAWKEVGLPTSMESLSNRARVSPREMTTAWKRSVGACFEERDGRLFNKKMESVRAEQHAKHDRRSNAGKRGVEAKRAQSTSFEPSIAPAMLEQCSSNAQALLKQLDREVELEEEAAPEPTVLPPPPERASEKIDPRGPSRTLTLAGQENPRAVQNVQDRGNDREASSGSEASAECAGTGRGSSPALDFARRMVEFGLKSGALPFEQISTPEKVSAAFAQDMGNLLHGGEQGAWAKVELLSVAILTREIRRKSFSPKTLRECWTWDCLFVAPIAPPKKKLTIAELIAREEGTPEEQAADQASRLAKRPPNPEFRRWLDSHLAQPLKAQPLRARPLSA